MLHSERSRQSSINKAQDYQSDIETKRHHDDQNIDIWDNENNSKLEEDKNL